MSKKWNSEIAFPGRSDYQIRCTGQEFGLSKSKGTPMVTLQYEVVAPETVDFFGEEITVAGTTFGLVQYLPLKSVGEDGEVDADKTKNAQERYKTTLRAFGLSDDNVNWDNPALAFEGKIVYAEIENRAEEKRNAPTSEDLKKGNKLGSIRVNPVTKKPLITNRPNITQIFGLVPEGHGTGSVARPF